MARFVVTGGAGFIGSALSQRLAKSEDSVVVIDNLSAHGSKENLEQLLSSQKIDFKEIDITNTDKLVDAFKGADYILHYAAKQSALDSWKDWNEYYRTNIIGTASVLEAAKKNEVKAVVIASSAAVYGQSSAPLQCEHHKIFPFTPYAITKATNEMQAFSYAKEYGLPVLCLRYFNVFGYGQNTAGYAVVPRFIEGALRGEIIIYGDGEQSRDFVYIDDIIGTTILAARWASAVLQKKTPPFELFNIGSGKETTINELAKLVGKLVGKDFKVIREQPRQGEIRRSKADISKAEKAFCYKPKTTLEEGLKKTIDWLKGKAK
ncbi:MAG: SDR family NAD(P)-dependent oxidoreductase [Candidatus Woesearchaeota archaeon]